MKTELQKLDKDSNEITLFLKEDSFLKRNKSLLLKIGLQVLIGGVGITALVTTGVGILPIALFSRNIITDFSSHVLVEEIMKINELINLFQTEQQCFAYIAI